MKLFNKIIAAAAGILALSSCMEDAIEPLEGKYPAPVTYELNTLKSQSIEKGEKTRTITLELANEEATLLVKFVSDKYYINSVSHTPVTADQAKNKSYIVGNGGSTFTVGGNSVPIESGSITATQGEGTYTFEGSLWLADESIIKVKSTVNLVFEADPEPVKLSTVLSAASNLANGVSTISMSLAQDGISSEMDMSTYQTIWHGEGNYLSIDLYSADGYLHEGTYTANTVGGEVSEGQFGIGYDTTVDWGFGPMEMKDWGTCWWTVGNGVATAQKVLEGTMTVTKKGSKWVIELISGEGKGMIWAKFEGAIEALTPEGSSAPAPEYTMTDKVEAVYDASYAVVAGVEKHLVTLTKGEETAAIFELITAEGGVIEGTFTSQEYASAAGLMGNGYSFPDWGVEGGSRYWVNGEMVLINPGETVEVAKLADGLYSFTGSTGYEFVAATADYVGGGDEPESDYTEFSKLLIYQPNQETDANYQPTGRYTSLTLKMGTEGMYTEVVNNGYYDETKIKGNGQVLSIDFYTADGTLAAGTYEACAEGGVVGEGEFGIGYDVEMWGMQMVWGTCVTPYENDAEGAIQKITDGTITVEVSGDVYTITLESSAVNARYVGTLTL